MKRYDDTDPVKVVEHFNDRVMVDKRGNLWTTICLETTRYKLMIFGFTKNGEDVDIWVDEKFEDLGEL